MDSSRYALSGPCYVLFFVHRLEFALFPVDDVWAAGMMLSLSGSRLARVCQLQHVLIGSTVASLAVITDGFDTDLSLSRGEAFIEESLAMHDSVRILYS